MSTVIQIKRSPNVTAPTTVDLAEGELAYSYDKTNSGAGAKLYIEVLDSGDSPVIHEIGGKYYTDQIDNATSANTASSLVRRAANGYIEVGAIVATNIYGTVTGTVTGQAQSANIANFANALTTGRYIKLSGDVVGEAFFDGTGNADISATVIQANSVALGVDTTGDYVSNVLAGTGIAVTGQGGETATPTVALTNTGVTANTYGGASKIPVLTIDATGRVTAAANVSVAGVSSFTASGNTFTIATADGGSFSASIQENSVRLGTDTTGAYVGNLVAGTGVTLSGLGNEGATPTIALENTAVTPSTYGGEASVGVFTVDQQGRLTAASNVFIAIPSSALTSDVALGSQTSGDYVSNVLAGTGISVTGQGGETATPTVNLNNTAVTPSTYGGAASVGVFTVDQQGRLTAASNVSIAIPASALTTDVVLGTGTSGAYVSNLIAGTGITITGLGNETTTPTITNAGVTSITGTANQITASSSTGAVTLSLPSSITTPGDLTVTGDLVVNGTALTVNTATVTVEDPLVKFGNANPADSLDIGFFGQYTSSGEKFAGLFRDASDSGKFKLFVDLTTDPTTNVINTANYTVATLVANLTGGTVSGLTANIAVSDGGTGRGTLTTNAVIYGQGTSAVGMATGSAGQVLQLNASGVPVFAGIDGGTY